MKILKKHIEFSKIIMVVIMLIYISVNLYVGYLLYQLLTNHAYAYISTPISTFLTFNGATVSVAVAYYSWKAKNENAVKLSKGDDINIEREYTDIN